MPTSARQPDTPYRRLRPLVLATVAIALLAVHNTVAAVRDEGAPERTAARPPEPELVRFLTQSTMGPTEELVLAVSRRGTNRWIDEQLSMPPTELKPYIDFLSGRVEADLPVAARDLPYHKVISVGNNVGYRNTSTAWMRAVLGGEDHLRQRVAWALSQILVVSNDVNVLAPAAADYYDLLARNAFGTYENLLLEVTRHPMMGRYLSYLNNRKAKPSINRYPDENYAREIMQLFTIGLWQLNRDGTRVLDEDGEPIPTYSNEDVQTLARVFTGFRLRGAVPRSGNWDRYDEPMMMNPLFHDFGAKAALDGLLDLPAWNMPATADVENTIAVLTKHDNTAPFVIRRLINHLVTSNPSGSYIERVVDVWDETGGNLGAVVKAILLDAEARDERFRAKASFGRLKDPVFRVTSLVRAFDCGSELGVGSEDYPGLQWWNPAPIEALLQEPLRSPSVFNFFEADYAMPGEIGDGGLRSPEFQILTDTSSATVPNYLWQGLTNGFHRGHYRHAEGSFECDLLAGTDPDELDLEALAAKADLLLTAGSLPGTQRDAILAMAEELPTPAERARFVVYGIAVSPAAAVQR